MVRCSHNLVSIELDVRSIELDAIVLAYTSDNLVRARIFSMKVLKLLDLRW